MKSNVYDTEFLLNYTFEKLVYLYEGTLFNYLERCGFSKGYAAELALRVVFNFEAVSELTLLIDFTGVQAAVRIKRACVLKAPIIDGKLDTLEAVLYSGDVKSEINTN